MARVVVVAAMLVACGGDDDDAGNDDVSGSGSTSESPASDELAFGDPCELVTAPDVEGVAGFAVDAVLTNVDDGLPGATCTYTGQAGEGTINVSVTPDGASFFAVNRDAELAEDGPDVGDDSYLVADGEIGVLAGDAFVQVNVFASGLTLDEHGAEIAELAVAAIG